MTVNGDLDFDPTEEFGLDPAGVAAVVDQITAELPTLTGSNVTPVDLVHIANVAIDQDAVIGPAHLQVFLRPNDTASK